MGAGDWIAAGVFLTGVLTTVAGILWGKRSGRAEGEATIIKRIQELHLAPADRERFDELIATLKRFPEAIDDHRRTVADHGAVMARGKQ